MDIAEDVLNYYSQPSVMTEISNDALDLGDLREGFPAWCGPCKVSWCMCSAYTNGLSGPKRSRTPPLRSY
jgi:hypothetical protein